MSNNNHATGVSKFVVGMMLSTALSTGYAFSQNTAPTDSIPTKPKTENVLFRFKENVLSIFKSGKDKVEKALGNKNVAESASSGDSAYVTAADPINDAISATRLKERHSKEHITRVAARDLLTNETNTTIDDVYAKYTYGDILQRNGGNMDAAVTELVNLTERPVNATAEQIKAADERYKSVTADFHTRNAKFQKQFVAATVRPDVKKDGESKFLGLLSTQTQLSQIMPESEILSAMNTEKHIGNMKNKSTVDNDSVASMERLVGFASVDLGAGDAQRLFRLVLQGKGDEKLSMHFKNYKAIGNNIIKPYDHENVINVENIDVKTLANMQIVKYIMKNAGAEQEKKLFVTKAVIQTVDEKQEAVKTEVVKEQVKPVENKGSVGEVIIEKGTFYYGYGREMTMANYGDPAGTMTKQDNPGTYAMNVTKMGYSHNFSNLEKSFRETGLPPEIQFTAGAEIGIGNINYKGLQYGGYDFPAFNKTLPVVGLNASIIRKKFTATAAMTNLINLKPGSVDEQIMIKKGVSSFWTMSGKYNVKEGVTKNGMQWHFDVGGSYTFSGANKNNFDGTDFIAIGNAVENGKYHTPFASTYALQASVSAAIPESVKMFGGTDIQFSLVRGGTLAKIGNGKPMTGVQLTISPKSIPFSKKKHSAYSRALFDSNVKTALERQSAKTGKTTNFVVTPRR